MLTLKWKSLKQSLACRKHSACPNFLPFYRGVDGLISGSPTEVAELTAPTGQNSPKVAKWPSFLGLKRSKKSVAHINKTFTGWKNVFIFTFMLLQTGDQKKPQMNKTCFKQRYATRENLSKYQLWLSFSLVSCVLKLHGQVQCSEQKSTRKEINSKTLSGIQVQRSEETTFLVSSTTSTPLSQVSGTTVWQSQVLQTEHQ